MRLITVLSTTTFVYCLATAVASQPHNVKLVYGVPRNAAAASRTVKWGKKGQLTQKALVTFVRPSDKQDFKITIGAPEGRGSKVFLTKGHERNVPAPPKTLNITVKKDSDVPHRRLMQEGSIRGGKTEDSAQRKRSLQDWKTAFEADVAMPIRLQSILMKKTSGDSNRRRELFEVTCEEEGDGSQVCHADDFPFEGSSLDLFCPASVSEITDCTSCALFAPDGTECDGCAICSDRTMAWDCSNVVEGECVIRDCDSGCDSTSTPPDSETTPPDSETTPPDSETTPPDSDTVEVTCEEEGDGSLVCHGDNYPEEGFSVDLFCPASLSGLGDCTSCTITADNGVECDSCTVCSDSFGAWDCSNVDEMMNCVTVDCDRNCDSTSTPPDSETTPPDSETTPPDSETTPPDSETTPPDSETTPPNPSTPPPTDPTSPEIPLAPGNPTSLASMRKLGILSIAATAIAAFGFF